MFPSWIVQILTLPKYSLKQQINRDEDSTRLFDRSYTWCAARANPWEEAHWRGHVPSACHSTNHLGEGLREEPIVALAGHHLDAGERVNRKHWSMRAGVAGEAGRRGGCASLMTWKRSRLATECDGWVGAGLHNLIQTTLPPTFCTNIEPSRIMWPEGHLRPLDDSRRFWTVAQTWDNIVNANHKNAEL